MSPVIWMLECRSIDDTALMSAPPAILVTSSIPIRRIHQLDEETELVAPSLMPLGAKHVYMAPCGLPDPVYPTVLGLTVIEVTGMSDFAGIPAAVTASINGATSISANAAAPTGTALMVTVAASDAAAFTSGPGSGWSALTGLAVSNGA